MSHPYPTLAGQARLGMKCKRNSDPNQLPGEEWRSVAECPFYEVSSLGRVRKMGAKHVRTLGKHKQGYWLVTLFAADGRKVARHVHRLVAIAFIPNPLNLPVVNHKDSDTSNARTDNLEWTTQKENIRLAMAIRGNWLKGFHGKLVPILRFDPDNGSETLFPSIRAACDELNRARVANGGVARPYLAMAGNICHAKNKVKISSGFYWCDPRKRLACAVIREKVRIIRQNPEARAAELARLAQRMRGCDGHGV